MNWFKERNDKLDRLLEKMEQVVQENIIVVSQIEAKKYREEASEKSEAFPTHEAEFIRADFNGGHASP